jgi:hypothetical protein
MSDPSAVIFETITALGWKRRDKPHADAKRGINLSTEVFEQGDLRITISIDRALTWREEISGRSLKQLRSYLETIDSTDPDFEFVTQLVKERTQRSRESVDRGSERRGLR